MQPDIIAAVLYPSRLYMYNMILRVTTSMPACQQGAPAATGVEFWTWRAHVADTSNLARALISHVFPSANKKQRINIHSSTLSWRIRSAASDQCLAGGHWDGWMEIWKCRRPKVASFIFHLSAKHNTLNRRLQSGPAILHPHTRI